MPKDEIKVAASAPSSVSSEAVAKRAYELYLHRGSVSGYEVEDWLQAEAELTAAATPAAAAASTPAKGRKR